MTTDNHPRVRDYSLLVPLLIGIFSLLGICLLLGSVWFPRQNTQAVPTQSLISLKSLLLAVETATPEPGSEITSSPEFLPAPTEISEGGGALVPPLTEQTRISTNGDLFTPTVTLTPNPIFDNTTPMTIGIYDDSDSHIVRTGNWINQKNVNNAHQGTLLISNQAGNYVAFNFIGTIMALGYQSSLGAGGVTVNIDGLELTLIQSVGNEWISQELPPGTHFVILTHASGDSVNLDYINIPE